jgi:phosphatidate cytidylyltransferase
MLLPRTITALVGIPLALAAVYFGGILYVALVAAITIICLYEYGLILLTGKKPVSRVSLIIFGVVMTIAAISNRVPYCFEHQNNIASFFIVLSVAGIFFVEMLSKKKSLERVANTVLGVFLIPWTLVHLINIRLIEPYGEYFTYILFISVWAYDVTAYFTGCYLGKHKLNKDISPKKTWEGAAGGLVAAVAAALICWNLFFPWYISCWQAVCLGVIIAAFAQLSDLAESLIKRSAGVKDSSNILPGHGGVLDRFDSFIFTAPVLYYVALSLVRF